MNKLYGVYNNPEAVDFDKLPKRFVIKANHASGYNLIVKDKAKLEIPKAKKLFKKWLATNYYYKIGQQWCYKNIKPRLIAEAYIEEEGKTAPSDYKFYCFDGEAKFIKLQIDRFGNQTEGFYDLNLAPCPFTKIGDFPLPSDHEMVDKPKNLKKMIALAEDLAAGFPFVKVDIYSVKERIIFGEMTFYLSDGGNDFYPDKYNKILGDYFVLPRIPEGQKRIN